MALNYEIHKGLAQQTLILEKKPSITGITRLETQPTAITLRQGLSAPVADPLWMLSRQWQFNEFQGEDAGTPLKLSFKVHGTKVDAFRPGADPATAWQRIGEHDVPIETRVEAERAWLTHPRLRGEAGQHALRMSTPPVRAALLKAFPITLNPPTDPDADRAGVLWSRVMHRRTIDALALAEALRPLRDSNGELTGLPPELTLAGNDANDARAMLTKWLRWVEELVYEGDPAQSSWQRSRMEYAFALKAGDARLESAEYTDAHVDWEDFEAGSEPPSRAPPIQHTFAVASRHPTPVSYPGMPADRFWEFEDGDVNFAGAEAGVTDLLRMSVTEFALTFGNDWFLTPARLPVGWLHGVTELTITDSFGVVTHADPIKNPDGTKWSLYSMTTGLDVRGRLQHTMLLPDSIEAVEGRVLEETTLVRDEMANLCWAIEHKVQGVSGEPLDRQLEAQALAFQQRIDFDGGLESPQLVYRLQTPVPANWTPLLPVREAPLDFNDPLTIRLARAGMKRFYPEASVAVIGASDPEYAAFLDLLDAQDNFIRRVAIGDGLRAYIFYPRGWMLRRDPNAPMQDSDTLLIEEEEVPRIGAILRRKFQYTRSSDGRTWLWIGRSKVAGRGEANSALRFDVAVKRETLR